MVADLLVLEVRQLDIVVHLSLLELGHIDPSLFSDNLPTVVSQVDAVAEALDRALKHLEFDLVDADVLLKLNDFLLDGAVDNLSLTWSQVLPSFAHVSPNIDEESQMPILLAYISLAL